MSLKNYVAEEIALDCEEGLLTRREALRRLGLLGLGAAASATLLAACASDDDDGAAPVTTSGGGATTSAAAGGGTSEEITFDGPRGDLMGAWAGATDPHGALLIIHENRGLSPHIKTLPARFAEQGYSSLAVDLLSDKGGTAAVGDEGAAQGALGSASTEQLVADLQAGIDELARRAPDEKIGAIGFCFGGGLTWQLLQAGEARLAAAAPFYGPAPDPADFSKAKAAVLAVYAGQDDRVNASRDRAVAALQAANLVHEVKVYPGVDHAFFNDTGPRYDAAAAGQAFADAIGWFKKYLG